MLLVILIFLGTAVLFVYTRIRDSHQKGKHVPGPVGLPLVGNLHQLGNHPYLTLAKWAKQYGDIYKVTLPTTQGFIINEPNLAKAFFSQDEFLGRVNKVIFEKYENGIHGVANLEGEHWKELQKFTIKELRELGLRSTMIEDLIHTEVVKIIEWMKAQNGQPIPNIKQKLEFAVVNSLWTIVGGQKFEEEEDHLAKQLERTHTEFKEVAKRGLAVMFLAPWIRHVLPEWSGYNKIRKVWFECRDFFANLVEEHKKTYSEDHKRDYIDAFLTQIKGTKDPKSVFYGNYGERQLVATIIDLFTGGTGTSSSTLAWTILYLSTFPQVQDKLQQEIQKVTGNTRLCSLSDIPQMPYAEAVTTEVLRYSSITPYSAPHLATEEKEFEGYFIPKDSIIVVNSYFIHRDPKIWGDPEHFRPERFLSEDGREFVKNDAMMPFSTGKRKCIGESFAKDTLFLFMTNIFQTFTAKLDPALPHPGLQAPPEFILEPPPFHCIFQEREL